MAFKLWVSLKFNLQTIPSECHIVGMGPLTGWGQSGRGVAIVTDNHAKRPRRQGESRKDEERRSIIRSLVELDRPVAELEKLLAPLPWDYPTALVTLTYDHIRSVLLRFLAGNLEAKDVEEWADLVEMRDDIEFAEDRTKEVVHMLSTPQIHFPIDGQLARLLLSPISH
ncbi:hypothetical protein EOB59_08185 [Mesorhizobium sp. M7A.F.Ca.MR.176.00.0.0]|uniref:hypothetical protein n=1 Tax=Mesorhizobium sp. M7A.F.Ca.MR.176.00.0.0 TaxID=2496776 RepID=UPI000FD3E809|nr:hypothetical protein [Mesorhizobium sp. M7A.F.Ca.MR.176.00.0.0]RUU92285.1 hypothetical protein EOB59_08185 [Mesorhizobium sp. M7A.F.Ca.MR.176.00.0.0]